jgi:hypothetical protein
MTPEQLEAGKNLSGLIDQTKSALQYINRIHQDKVAVPSIRRDLALGLLNHEQYNDIVTRVEAYLRKNLDTYENDLASL